MLDFIASPEISSILFFGNTLFQYATALTIFLGLYVVFWLVEQLVLSRLTVAALRTETEVDDTLINIVRSIRPPMYVFIALYISIQFLAVHQAINLGVKSLVLIFLVWQAATVIDVFIDYIAQKRMGEEATGAPIGMLKLASKFILWSIGLLLVLSNLGIDITSLVTGLGIGGIAIALAVQNILGDVFSSLAIYFDKPFEVGDFIEVGEHKGTVEKIGIKTSRIRSLQGEELVVSNVDLTSARIKNFKKMEKRRAAFTIGVSYQTTHASLKQIPGMIEKIIVDQGKMVEFGRAHFKMFGESALIFEVVFFVLDSDYDLFMDLQQQINLDILAAFDKKKIEIAYPTQTIHVVK